MSGKFAFTALLGVALSSGCAITSGGGGGSAPDRAEVSWWKSYGDSALNKDITTALSSNPGLEGAASRIERAEASVSGARAAMLPRLNLGIGYSEGRQREVDFGPYTLAPWETGAGLSWELDFSGKLRAAKRSAEGGRDAAVWDLRAARLVLASRIAALRFNLYRFNVERDCVAESLAAMERSVGILEERSSAGLTTGLEVSRLRAEKEKLLREKIDIERLRDLTVVQLRTLRGGTEPGSISDRDFPSAILSGNSSRNLKLEGHPEIMAAEARLRAAFDLEMARRLDLLPSFKLGALASGRTNSLGDTYRSWIAKVGPSMDIPIYDPGRIAAAKAGIAERKSASANYRETVLKVLGEIDSAKINLRRRTNQLAAAEREVDELNNARKLAREQFDSGLTSEMEFLDVERAWLDAKRSRATLEQARLNAEVDLIKASGGGVD
ncbi:MAG: TolC family protein [Luteolibacter sp.]